MISFIAASINYVILVAALLGIALAVYLYRRSKSVPNQMRDTMLATAKRWGISNASQENDLKLILGSLSMYVETADAERRAELRGFIMGGDRKPDLDLDKLQMSRTIAKILTEVFPLLGILGTVCALSVSVGISNEAGIATTETLKSVIGLFGTAIDSTIYGLICAVIFMFTFGALDSRIEVSLDIVRRYRDVIDKAVLLSTGRED